MSGPFEHRHDFSTRLAAQCLADMIASYWRQNGHPEVVTWIESTGSMAGSRGPRHHAVWGVKSNLVNGLPPGRGEE